MSGTHAWSGREFSIPVEEVVDVLEDIRERNGVIVPQVVVNEAEPETHPMHDLFEWDDVVAGNEYRKDQARHVIRSVKVILDGGPLADQPPAYVSVKVETGQRGYLGTVEVMHDEDLAVQALNDCIRNLRGFRRRYGTLHHPGLGATWAAIDAIPDPQPPRRSRRRRS